MPTEIKKVDVMEYTWTEDKKGLVLTDGVIYQYFDQNGSQWSICKEIADLMTEQKTELLETRSDLTADDLVKLKEKYTVDDIIRLRSGHII